MLTSSPTAATAPSLTAPAADGAGWDGLRPGQAGYGKVLAGVAVGGMANFVLLYYVQPLLPSLAGHYGVSAASSAQALSISTLAMAAALLVVGPLSDAIGRVALMRVSLVASGVLGVASAFVTSWGALLTVRALMGVTLAALPAIALAYLREEVHPSAHLRANAVYIAGTATGGALGRLLPGPLDALWGWAGTTVAISALSLAAGALMIATVPPSRGFSPRPLRPRAIASGMRAAVADPVIVALCVVGFATMGAFVGLYNAVGFRLEAPPYLLGGSATLVYLAYPVGIAAPSVARRMAAGGGRPRAALVLAGALAVGTVITLLSPVVAIVVGLGVLTAAFLGLHSLSTGWVVDRARRVGVGTAQASSNYLLAYYTGSAVLGALATHRWEAGGWTAVVVLSLAMVLLAAAALVVAGRRDRAAAA